MQVTESESESATHKVPSGFKTTRTARAAPTTTPTTTWLLRRIVLAERFLPAASGQTAEAARGQRMSFRLSNGVHDDKQLNFECAKRIFKCPWRRRRLPRAKWRHLAPSLKQARRTGLSLAEVRHFADGNQLRGVVLANRGQIDPGAAPAEANATTSCGCCFCLMQIGECWIIVALQQKQLEQHRSRILFAGERAIHCIRAAAFLAPLGSRSA